MKNPIILICLFALNILNILWLKRAELNVLIILSFSIFLLILISGIFKNKKCKLSIRNEIIALIIWTIVAIPTVVLVVMTIIFGFPPEGYSALNLF